MADLVSSVFKGGGFIDITPYQYGREVCGPGYAFGPARRSHYLFHYVILGKGRLDYTRRDAKVSCIELGAGEGFMIFPEQVNTYQADWSLPWQYIWIEFDGPRMRERLEALGLSEDNPRYRPTSQEQRDRMMQEMLYIVDHRDESPLSVMGHVCLFFDSFMRSMERPTASGEERLEDRYVRKAIRLIEEGYQDGITIEEVAAGVGLSRSYLGSLFKKVVGRSPQQLLMECRMSQAAELLKLTSLPIAQVGRAVGYANQLHFSRAFKSYHGMSPREWRRRGLAGTLPEREIPIMFQ